MSARVPVGLNEIDLETFIEELAQTGVSPRFLEEARPQIARAFTEVPPAYRPECLEAIRTTIKTQAETEASLRQSLQQVERLVVAEEALTEKLRLLRQSARVAADAAAAAAFGMFRPARPPKDMN